MEPESELYVQMLTISKRNNFFTISIRTSMKNVV